MNRQHLAAGAVVIGLLLVVVSLIWPSISDPKSAWTDEDAKEYEQTVARVHAGGELTDRGQDLKTRLERARERPYRIAGVLKWSGAALVAGGAMGLFLLRQSDK